MPDFQGKHIPTGWDILLTPQEMEQRREHERNQSKLQQWVKNVLQRTKNEWDQERWEK